MGVPGKSPYEIELSAEERIRLEAVARSYTSPYRDVVRAKIVLHAAAGLRNEQIAARIDLPRQIVSKWRKRFFEERLLGLDERPCPCRAGVFRNCSARWCTRVSWPPSGRPRSGAGSAKMRFDLGPAPRFHREVVSAHGAGSDPTSLGSTTRSWPLARDLLDHTRWRPLTAATGATAVGRGAWAFASARRKSRAPRFRAPRRPRSSRSIDSGPATTRASSRPRRARIPGRMAPIGKPRAEDLHQASGQRDDQERYQIPTARSRQSSAVGVLSIRPSVIGPKATISDVRRASKVLRHIGAVPPTAAEGLEERGRVGVAVLDARDPRLQLDLLRVQQRAGSSHCGCRAGDV
jgi:hypothetical protein